MLFPINMLFLLIHIGSYHRNGTSSSISISLLLVGGVVFVIFFARICFFFPLLCFKKISPMQLSPIRLHLSVCFHPFLPTFPFSNPTKVGIWTSIYGDSTIFCGILLKKHGGSTYYMRYTHVNMHLSLQNLDS